MKPITLNLDPHQLRSLDDLLAPSWGERVVHAGHALGVAARAVGAYALLSLAPALLAQERPIIKSIVNSASYTQQIGRASLVTAFGTGLADQACQAQTVPLPTTLCGATIIDKATGNPLPLFYVSPTQINFQISAGWTGEAATMSNAYKVLRSTAESNEVNVTITQSAPGIYTWGNQHAAAIDNNYKLIGPHHAALIPAANAPLDNRSIVSVFATGCGVPEAALEIGTATPTDKLYALPTPTITLNGQPLAGEHVLGAFVAPGFASGVCQLIFTVPANARAGANIVQVRTPDGESNPATLNMTRTGTYLAGSAEVMGGDVSRVRVLARGERAEGRGAANPQGNWLVEAPADTTLELILAGKAKAPVSGNDEYLVVHHEKNITVNGAVDKGVIQLAPDFTHEKAKYDPDHSYAVPTSVDMRPELGVWKSSANAIHSTDMIFFANTYALRTGPCHISDGLTIRWQELPINVFVDPNVASPAVIADSKLIIDEINNSKRPYLRGDFYSLFTRPQKPNELGININLSKEPAGESTIGQYRNIKANGCIEPLTGEVFFKKSVINDSHQFKHTLRHELGHGAFFFNGIHSVESTDVMYFYAGAENNHPFSVFDARSTAIIYFYKPQTKLTQKEVPNLAVVDQMLAPEWLAGTARLTGQLSRSATDMYNTWSLPAASTVLPKAGAPRTAAQDIDPLTLLPR